MNVVWKPCDEHRVDERAEHALDCEIDVGDEIDRPLLVDVNRAADVREPHVAGADDGLDGRGDEEGIRLRAGGASARQVRRHTAARLVMRISIPPSGARCSVTSSMKFRMRKMPRPLDFNRFSGASGLAMTSGSNPSPWSRTRMFSSGAAGGGGVANST